LEGRGFRDRAPDFAEAGIELVGVSFDTPEDNRTFAEKNEFPFRLLSDVDRKVGEAYETKRAPEERSPTYAKRRTYLIDPEGRIVKAYRVTDIAGHPAQVLEDFRSVPAERSA
jgi:thioredoxin-dependent peroxiredoxin